MQITFNDFVRFIRAVQKTDNPACSVCENTEFSITTDFEIPEGKFSTLGFLHTTPDGGEVYTQGHLPVLLINCTRCGNIQVFRRNIVASWLQDNPAEKPHG